MRKSAEPDSRQRLRPANEGPLDRPSGEDRWGILDYLEERNPEAALNLDEDISRTVKRLERFPKSARIGRISGTREAVIGNYILVYEIRGEWLVITHLVHGAMEFPPVRR